MTSFPVALREESGEEGISWLRLSIHDSHQMSDFTVLDTPAWRSMIPDEKNIAFFTLLATPDATAAVVLNMVFPSTLSLSRRRHIKL